MKIRVKYHDKHMPKLQQIEKGNWIDLRVIGGKINGEKIQLEEKNNLIKYKKGDFLMLNLGVALEIPKGYEAYIVPRSSTYKTFGLIQTNHIGIVDDTYIGDNDIYHMPCYALRDGEIELYERVCQFRIQESMPKLEIEEVDFLDNGDRGGFGTTGTK